MSISNLLPTSQILNSTFATNGKTITSATVRGNAQLTIPLEIAKINGQVTCVIPQFEILSYGVIGTDTTIVSFRPVLPVEYRPAFDLTTSCWFIRGGGPGIPEQFAIIVHSNGFINICDDPTEIAAEVIPINSYLVSDTVITWLASQ